MGPALNLSPPATNYPAGSYCICYPSCKYKDERHSHPPFPSSATPTVPPWRTAPVPREQWCMPESENKGPLGSAAPRSCSSMAGFRSSWGRGGQGGKPWSPLPPTGWWRGTRWGEMRAEPSEWRAPRTHPGTRRAEGSSFSARSKVQANIQDTGLVV